MSELIIDYPAMITVLERMGISFGFGDQRVRDIAERYKVDIEAFIALLRSFEGSLSQDTYLEKDAIPDLLSFLKSSHRHFKEKQIPGIKELIALFSENIPAKHGQVLISFFDGYIREVEEHFHYEDDDIFPYISDILTDPHPTKFRMSEFEKNHTNIEQKLLDLKNILVKYIPEDITSYYRIEVLKELFSLEQDLIRHSFIEDHLLVPSVKKMEYDIQS
jgi:regulator of cell morphogenesis and NO signaling